MSEPTDPPKKGMSNLAIRLTTAAVGIPIILWLLYWAPRWIFSAIAPVAAIVAAYELAAMTMRDDRPLRIWMMLSAAIVTAVLVFVPSPQALTALIFGLVITGALALLVRPDPLSEASAIMGWMIAGPLYAGGALAAIAKLHHLSNGGTWVVLAMAFAWGSDTGGYFAGRALGRHKLYEKISPKKTIEGSIGGLVASVLLALAIRWLWLPALPWVHAITVALLAGGIGQAGDLCISVIKRSTGVKDSGHIIPGHGGLLDRIDALMFTAVVTLLYASWVLELPATIPRFWS